MADNKTHHNQGDYNKSGMVVFVLSMIASLGIMIYVSFFGGIDLKEVTPKAAVEQKLAAQEAAKPVDVSGVKDPWMSSDQMVAAGKQVYAINCAMCHGVEGKGDGIAGQSLNPKPRNFVEGKWTKGGGRIALMNTINEGVKDTSMVGFKHLPLNDRWALVHYIRSVTQNKVADKDADVAAKASSIK